MKNQVDSQDGWKRSLSVYVKCTTVFNKSEPHYWSLMLRGLCSAGVDSQLQMTTSTSGFKPQLSLAQQSELFCLNTFKNGPTHTNDPALITRATHTWPHCEITVPLQQKHVLSILPDEHVGLTQTVKTFKTITWSVSVSQTVANHSGRMGLKIDPTLSCMLDVSDISISVKRDISLKNIRLQYSKAANWTVTDWIGNKLQQIFD